MDWKVKKFAFGYLAKTSCSFLEQKRGCMTSKSFT